MKNEISEEEAFLRITEPFREFMLSQVRDKDLQTFEALAAESYEKGAKRPPRSRSTCASSSRRS